MISVRLLAIAVCGVILNGPSISGQDLSRYREYALESSLASVLKASGARADDVKTLHERPAKIQELEWRAPYVFTGTERPDPVRGAVFGFYNDQLFQIVITYDRERMEGLTNEDLIESISATYGMPVLASARTTRSAAAGPDVLVDTVAVARWEDAASSLTLFRSTYSRECQLVLISKTLKTRARTATREGLRLDAREAPQREIDQRKKDVADARAAQEKARLQNKAAFKP
jgi:hypothetical protein